VARLAGATLRDHVERRTSMRRLLAAVGVVGAGWADGGRAKDTVRIAFVGPLTGGNSAIGLGGRNSADLAVKLRNADAKARHQYELVVLDDECKPDTGVQVATQAGSDRGTVVGVTHDRPVASRRPEDK